jgi:hypothetical protein
MRLGTCYSDTILYVSHSAVGSSVWSKKVVPADGRVSVSPAEVKRWRTFSEASCPLLLINKPDDRLEIAGVQLEVRA